jgi:hypothetical protein
MELNPQGRFDDLPAGPLPMALWLYVTDDDPGRPDRRWADRCEELHKISVGGTHLTMLSPPTRDVVLAEIAKLEVALRGKLSRPEPIAKLGGRGEPSGVEVANQTTATLPDFG